MYVVPPPGIMSDTTPGGNIYSSKSDGTVTSKFFCHLFSSCLFLERTSKMGTALAVAEQVSSWRRVRALE